MSVSSVSGSGSGQVPVTAPLRAGAKPAAGAAAQLNTAQVVEVAKLAATDRHVRAHEQAHLAAAGPYATSGPSYTFATGPDGQRYAVAGDVGIDVSPDPTDPEKTIAKAETIMAAANAPADPSSQDRAVSAAAAQMKAAAERELNGTQVAAAYSAPQDATASLISLLA